MKILVVANMYPSEKDPVYGTFVKNFVEDLRHREGSENIDLCTIYGRRMGVISKLKTYIEYYSRLTVALAKSHHDLVYVHTITFPILPIRLIGLFKRLPLVLNVHGDDVLPSNKLKKLLKRIAKPVVEKAMMVVAPSKYFKGVLEKEFPKLNPGSIYVSPSGGLASMFYRPKQRIDNDKALHLGFVSRIDKGKGWDLFVELIEQLNRQGIACNGTIAGRGAQIEDLQQLIKSKSHSDKIHYIGPQPQEKLPGLYGSFDLFIFPSYLNESLGLVGVEAMAAGTPVVASDMAGPKGYVENGVNGYLFRQKNLNSLIDAVREYALSDSEVRNQMSHNAYTTALDYQADKVGQSLYERLRQLQ